MRPAPLAALVLAAACLGAVLALVVGQGTGWLGSGTKTTVVLEPGSELLAESARGAATAKAAKPLPGSGFDPEQIYANRVGGVVTIYSFFDSSASPGAREAQGSGFVVSHDGVVLTNAHVITDAGEVQSSGDAPPAPDLAREVYVEFHDGDRVAAKVVGYDLFDDVGVIRVGREHALEPVPLGDSSKVVIGQPVAAIGTPFGNEGSLTVGVVSATRSIDSLTSRYDVVDAIQTDAPITHGNSGGPLFDARGRVIGINAQIRSGQGQSGFEGVGFAVPINSARRSMGQLLARGRVAYAYLGITTEDLTPAVAKRLGYAVEHGALIDVVQAGTAAAHAGLRAGTRDVRLNGETIRAGGDVIVSVDGQTVRSSGDLIRIVSARLVPGQTARVVLMRGKQRKTVTLRLDERPR
jgi:S1-C subfamily serine protease